MQGQVDETSGIIVLEEKNLRVVIDPHQGGKIRSFYSRRTGIEYLYQDPRSSFTPGSGYGSHDISGFDECFPTVHPCTYPDGPRQGLDLGDHGLLWQQPWESEICDGQVTMRCTVPRLRCDFKRTCQIDSGAVLTLDYQITNHDQQPLKFIYSAHPLLAAGRDTHFVLSDDVNDVYVYYVANATGIPQNSWITWPPSQEENFLAPYSTNRHSCLKAYSRPLGTGRAAVRHADHGERLQFDFDPAELPHLGILISQGFDEDPAGDFAGELILALEPTTGIGDDLLTCEQTGTTAQLAPHQTKSFRIQLSLVDD